MNDPILKLTEKITNLTATQRKVADYIIKNPMEVAFLTVDQLAGIVGTSTTTIMRLTFNLNYSGYTEFQKELQELLRNQAAPQTRLEANLKGVTENDLWNRCVDNQISNINKTKEVISSDTLKNVIDLIISSNRIYCTSAKSGLPVGQYLNFGLNRLLGNSELIIADQSDWVDLLLNLDSDDLIIATSFPRYARRIVDLVSYAKDRGVKIITLTDGYSSPLVKYSDIVLPCNPSSLAFHNSPIAAMVVADYIISSIAINYPDKTKERLDNMNNVLTKIQYHFNSSQKG
ncbi:MurR/RpiR family transcriptional regulator [Alkalihalophilus pseudofirmus]|uniref:MurR/RpiR family transcriptional regulator n=1 Tax=Alkalihalophilus pseudofirmus TaxID=79885 RepID=A0AAJ2NNC2_ALKPS|nr:MurR/RpiR family transcriptional regulator [Alkalihalophilus pseudofirmus]MDV2885520.1 MurR/RpiR family transcriptional regulator [Alkalihalophilus pseudofirmus]